LGYSGRQFPVGEREKKRERGVTEKTRGLLSFSYEGKGPPERERAKQGKTPSRNPTAVGHETAED